MIAIIIIRNNKDSKSNNSKSSSNVNNKSFSNDNSDGSFEFLKLAFYNYE